MREVEVRARPVQPDRRVTARARQRTRGFTLIEIFIALGIIALLAALAIPMFTVYRLRAKTVEAKTCLAAIRVGQDSFFTAHDDYANVTTITPSAPASAGQVPWEDNACDAACASGNTAVCTSFACIGFEPSGAVNYRYASPHLLASGGGLAEFAAGASADLDQDGDIGSFGYRSANTPALNGVGALADGVSLCPVDIPAFQVYPCTFIEF